MPRVPIGATAAGGTAAGDTAASGSRYSAAVKEVVVRPGAAVGGSLGAAAAVDGASLRFGAAEDTPGGAAAMRAKALGPRIFGRDLIWLELATSAE